MAKKTKPSFKVTFGYKAVISVTVKADTATEAEAFATQHFNDKFRLPGANNIVIDDDSFKVSGINNETESWDMLYQE